MLFLCISSVDVFCLVVLLVLCLPVKQPVNIKIFLHICKLKNKSGTFHIHVFFTVGTFPSPNKGGKILQSTYMDEPHQKCLTLVERWWKWYRRDGDATAGCTVSFPPHRGAPEPLHTRCSERRLPGLTAPRASSVDEWRAVETKRHHCPCSSNAVTGSWCFDWATWSNTAGREKRRDVTGQRARCVSCCHDSVSAPFLMRARHVHIWHNV